MFEEATRNKYRFQSEVGNLDVEDLWDLKVKALDKIYKGLKSQLKETTEDSLLEIQSAEDTILDNKIAIVTHIFNVKQIEANERLLEKDKADKKARLLEILADKQDESLKNKSEDELKQMIDEL